MCIAERRETTKERERSEKKVIRSDKKETPARESTREPTPREQTPREATREREREKTKEPKKEEKREKDDSEGPRKRDKEARRGEKRSSPATFYDQTSFPIDVDMDNPREPRERGRVERERDLSSVSNSSNGSVNRTLDPPPPENDRGEFLKS